MQDYQPAQKPLNRTLRHLSDLAEGPTALEREIIDDCFSYCYSVNSAGQNGDDRRGRTADGELVVAPPSKSERWR